MHSFNRRRRLIDHPFSVRLLKEAKIFQARRCHFRGDFLPRHQPLGGSAATILSCYCLDKSVHQQKKRTVWEGSARCSVIEFRCARRYQGCERTKMGDPFDCHGGEKTNY